MNTNNYLPFDLETALKYPERVVTRDGRKVQELHCFKKTNSNQQSVYCVIDGIPQSNWQGGQWCGEPTIKSDYDLFLLPEVKECWVNVYYNKWGQIWVEPNSYLIENDARIRGKSDSDVTYIKTIRITNEPE